MLAGMVAERSLNSLGIGAVLLALLGAALAGCAEPGGRGAGAGLPPIAELTRHHDDHAHHEGELLVLDPPPGYLAHLPQLGLSLIDVTHLAGLGSDLYHLKADEGAHAFHARHLHDTKFPHIAADIHHHFEQHAGRQRKSSFRKSSYTSRRSANWGAPRPGCGKGIHIGVVDGGVDTGHAALKGRDVTFRSFHLKGQRAGAIAHGTAVTSILVGTRAWGGLLPEARISAANVFHQRKSGKSRASAKSVLQAVSWLIERRVQVINMSIGGSPNMLIGKAVAKAAKQGIIIIASAGNSGPFNKKKNYPAAYEKVIAIAASDRFDRVARFSSAGAYVEFTAPGVGIWSAVPGGGKAMSGTSFAAPIMTGFTAALIKYGSLSGLDAIRRHFRENAKKRGKKDWDKYSGWGFVRIAQPC